MTTIATFQSPTLASRFDSLRTWLMRHRPVRTVWIACKAVHYLFKFGVRQICWLVESLELEHGHFASRVKQLPIDAHGQPLPWYTYPAIQYFSQLDLSDHEAFEFGSGNGSLFWSARTRSLISVESDPQWHGMILAKKRDNQQVILEENLDAYPGSIHRTGKKFDLIIVDGKCRRPCAVEAIKCLAENGMVILDNSDWYPKTAQILRNAGLIQIDFSGYGPVNNYTWTTSLFLTRSVQLRPRSSRMPEPGIGSLVQSGDE